MSILDVPVFLRKFAIKIKNTICLRRSDKSVGANLIIRNSKMMIALFDNRCVLFSDRPPQTLGQSEK